MHPNAQTAQPAWAKVRLTTFSSNGIVNKHHVDDTRLENQRVAMEDVR